MRKCVHVPVLCVHMYTAYVYCTHARVRAHVCVTVCVCMSKKKTHFRGTHQIGHRRLSSTFSMKIFSGMPMSSGQVAQRSLNEGRIADGN